MKVMELNIIPENTPHSVAAGIIYMISLLCKLPISKNEIMKKSNIRENDPDAEFHELFTDATETQEGTNPNIKQQSIDPTKSKTTPDNEKENPSTVDFFSHAKRNPNINKSSLQLKRPPF